MGIEHEMYQQQRQETPEQLKLGGDGKPPTDTNTLMEIKPPQTNEADVHNESHPPKTEADSGKESHPPESSLNGDDSRYDVNKFLTFLQPKDVVNKQSVIYDEAENIRVSPMVKDGRLLEFLYDDAKTMHEAFLRGLRVSNNGNCLGYRPEPNQPYKWLPYQEILDRAQRVGSALIAKGAEANTSQFIGIFSQNRVEWSITEQACNAFSMVSVPLYDTLGPQAMRHIVHQCDLEYIVVDKNTKAENLLKDDEIKMKLLIIVEDPTEDVKNLAQGRGIEIMTFAQLEELGKKDLKDFVPPSSKDLHTVCYTSGTTGNPKGVMLSHGTVIADCSSLQAMGKDSFVRIQPCDVHMSYLPMAHMFEKVIQGLLYMNGASMGFFQGDIKLLLSDVAELKPTVFPMVPRLMNKIYDRIMAGASQSRVKKMLLDMALNSKMKALKRGIVTRNTIWDKLVFKKIVNTFGGRVRLCVTGAAPISPTVLNFMRCSLGIPFTEGYGQTEATAGISVTIPGDYSGGNVGSPVPGVFVKLVDVPEKNYYAKDNKGEVCVKGPIIFQGYYKDPEKTKQAVDEDGWLHTGDVGCWLPNGSLKIFDRSKHIFKLAQGEYIAPEKIEQVYVQSAAVAQVFVHGDSLKASLVVVAVPDPETVVGWCAKAGIKGTYEDICSNDKAAELILKDMNAIGTKNGLHSFEMAKKIHLSTELFSIENNLLTPTFKSRRPQLLERYRSVIDEMYTHLE